MWIGLEGCDGTGKSTLAESIAERLEGAQIVHRGPPERDILNEYALDVEDYRAGEGKHFVADRWHLGELIYGPLYRDTPPDVAKFRWIELFLASRGATFAVVTNPLEVIRARLAARGEDFLKEHHVEQVNNEFVFAAKTSSLCRDIVMPDGNTDRIVDLIIDRADAREIAASVLENFPQYIGPPLPDVLLVGDKKGGEPPHDTLAPFRPHEGSSGRYLLESLDDQLWKQTGIVNAQEADLDVLWDVLAGPPIVALGNEPSDHLSKLGIEHVKVPHPQYVRRFHHSYQLQYGAMIRDAARGLETEVPWQT